MLPQFGSSSFPQRLLHLCIPLLISALLGCEPPQPESSSVEQTAAAGNVPLDIPPPTLRRPTGRQVQPTPTRAVSPEQQIADLSSILAHRERMRQYGDIPLDPAWHDNPPNPPRALQVFREAHFNVHMQQICGEWLPVVLLFPGPSPTLEDLLEVDSTIPFGIEFQFAPETSDFLTKLKQHAPENLVHLTVGLTHVPVEQCRQLGELPHIKSIQTGSGLTPQKFYALTQNDSFEAITITHLHDDFSGNLLAGCLSGNGAKGLKHLQRLHVGDSHPPYEYTVYPVYEALTQLPQLEYINIEPAGCCQDAFIYFLNEGDHEALRALHVNTEPLVNGWELNRLPNVEELTLRVDCNEGYCEAAAICARMLNHNKLRKLKLIPLDDPDGDSMAIAGKSATDFIKAISNHQELELMDVPLEVSAPALLDPLTRLPKLRVFAVYNLDLNYESLSVFARMPRLDNLTVRSLDFGPEVNHLLPWLSIRTLHIENPATLTDERARQLGQIPRLWHVSYWGAPGLKLLTTEDIPQIEFQEYD